MKPDAPTPIALTIAGSDSGGGAGIQADLKAFSAQGVYGASVITAVTAQNTQQVSAVHPIPTDVIAQQIKTVLGDINVSAIKIGMLGMPDVIEAVAKALDGFKGPIVLDPVMIAKSGDKLLPGEAIDALKTLLLPKATLLTPNIPEAATLLSQDVAHHPEALLAQGEALKALGAQNVLMKGGHSLEQTCTDWLITSKAPFELSAPRIDTSNTHGTGCSYSSAITARLALGDDLQSAVKASHHWLHQAIKAADQLKVGRGHGPVHHFHALWHTL